MFLSVSVNNLQQMDDSFVSFAATTFHLPGPREFFRSAF